MVVPKLTLTGIDARTDVNDLKKMLHDIRSPATPWSLEFAILRSPKVGQSARYPDRDTIRKVTDHIYPQNLAFHLCGRYARMVHSLEWDELCDIIDFSQAGRVQVNSTACDEKAMITLQRFSAHISRDVIMQWRGDVFPSLNSVSLLQDRSGGTGVRETNWASPDDLCKRFSTKVGYAGGLNPENVADALVEIRKAAQGIHFWIDCESGIRTDDWFDIAKAWAMAAAVFYPQKLGVV